jgi:glycogen synthase
MKLLIYSHYFAPSVGGVESIVMSLARGLTEIPSSSAIVVTVVTNTDAGAFNDAALPFKVIRNPTFSRLLDLVKQSDLVHVSGPALGPMFASYLKGKPFVIEHHSYQSICPNGVLLLEPKRSICPGYFQAHEYQKCLSCRAAEVSAIKALVDVVAMFPRRFFAKRASANIGVSKHVVDRIKLPNSLPIYHGIDDPPPSAVSSAAKRNTFAFVGRFVPEKGIPVLLEACAILKTKHPDFTLRLVGDGPQRPVIEEKIASLKLNDVVQLTGFLSGLTLESALSDVIALVMPSVWEETAGLSAMEQMMRGRLVIATSVAGLGEMVGEGGLLTQIDSPQSVADVMLSVIQNPQLAAELGRKARERALQFFSRRRMIEDHIKLYSSILAAKA